MPPDRIKQKIIFVDVPENPISEKKSILHPRMAIINDYKLIAVFYCTSCAILFYYVVENIFPGVIRLPALPGLVTNAPMLIQTKKIIPKTYIILKIDTPVVLSLFATFRLAIITYLLKLYNYQNHQQP